KKGSGPFSTAAGAESAAPRKMDLTPFFLFSLGFLPQAFHCSEPPWMSLPGQRPRVLHDVRVTTLEFADRVGERAAGVHLQVPRQVHRHEQQVAEFLARQRTLA